MVIFISVTGYNDFAISARRMSLFRCKLPLSALHFYCFYFGVIFHLVSLFYTFCLITFFIQLVSRLPALFS